MAALYYNKLYAGPQAKRKKLYVSGNMAKNCLGYVGFFFSPIRDHKETTIPFFFQQQEKVPFFFNKKKKKVQGRGVKLGSVGFPETYNFFGPNAEFFVFFSFLVIILNTRP